MILQARNWIRILWVSILVVGVISCSISNDQKDTELDVQQATLKWIDPEQIQPGPIRHESLTDEQLTRLGKVYDVFAQVDGQPIKVWIDNFKRDIDPDQELAIWEIMASAYSQYCDNRELSLEAKREVYQVVLLRSMVPEDQVLQHLELKVLSVDDAREVMQGFPGSN